jgi:hypothetical protein
MAKTIKQLEEETAVKFQELQDKIELQQKDIKALSESLMEHIANLDQDRDDVVESIVSSIDDKISEAVKKELAVESEQP